MFHFYFKIRQLSYLLCCVLLWQSCNTINPKEQTPTYIHVDSFSFTSNFPGKTSSTQITAVSVFYNNSSVGVFDLPANIPVRAMGQGQMTMQPVIAVNGRNSIMTVYPFYTADTFTFTAEPGKIITHIPHSTYYTTTKFQTISDFTGNPNFKRVGGNRDLLAIKSDTFSFEGGSSGIINMVAYGDSSVDSSGVLLTVPLNGSAIIEFNYKSSCELFVGLQANLSNVYSAAPYFLAGIKPSDHWQKFYLNISDFHATYKGTSYNFYIKTMLSDGKTSGQLLIDNIQLLTF